MTVRDVLERVLVVEDDDAFREALAEVLRAAGYAVETDRDGAAALETLQSATIDIVITDLVMPGIKGEALVEHIRSTFPEIPVIAITAFGSIEGALELTRAGATDYLAKPFRTRALLESVEQSLAATRARRERAHSERRFGPHVAGIVGTSGPMVRLFERIARVAHSPAPVLITGESGTGKELIARAVHATSGRGPFVPVNCGGFPPHLLESELFGHVAGAFTGAAADKPGLFHAADGGTLFLDEIAELPVPLQPKLLRAVEAGEVRRVGAVDGECVDVRVLAATHRDLEATIADGEFREDLFWRLAVLHLEVPALRERPADVPLLVEEFLARRAGRDDRPDPRITPDALAALVEFSWPGNVRQLFNVLERAATFAPGREIRFADLPAQVRDATRHIERVRDAADRSLTLAELEREYILEVLRRVDGNKTRAAEVLGIPRRTLYRRLEAYSRDES